MRVLDMFFVLFAFYLLAYLFLSIHFLVSQSVNNLSSFLFSSICVNLSLTIDLPFSLLISYPLSLFPPFLLMFSLSLHLSLYDTKPRLVCTFYGALFI